MGTGVLAGFMFLVLHIVYLTEGNGIQVATQKNIDLGSTAGIVLSRLAFCF